jgi:hypothetical protein
MVLPLIDLSTILLYSIFMGSNNQPPSPRSFFVLYPFLFRDLTFERVSNKGLCDHTWWHCMEESIGAVQHDACYFWTCPFTLICLVLSVEGMLRIKLTQRFVCVYESWCCIHCCCRYCCSKAYRAVVKLHAFSISALDQHHVLAALSAWKEHLLPDTNMCLW